MDSFNWSAMSEPTVKDRHISYPEKKAHPESKATKRRLSMIAKLSEHINQENIEIRYPPYKRKELRSWYWGRLAIDAPNSAIEQICDLLEESGWGTYKIFSTPGSDFTRTTIYAW